MEATKFLRTLHWEHFIVSLSDHYKIRLQGTSYVCTPVVYMCVYLGIFGVQNFWIKFC